ncbi:MAG: hypothetical protein L0216_21315 [Planctomycetales bacterium]|nr:hypothetical protein [Planctomycetales bacterium]
MALATVLWMFLFLVLVFGLGALWAPLLDKKGVRFVLAPGFLAMVVLKHVACLLAAAKVRESRPFGPGDEIVEHAEPKLPGIGNLLVAAIPFFGLVVAFCLAHWALGNPLALPRDLPPLVTNLDEIARFGYGLSDYVQGAVNVVRRLPGSPVAAWVVAYLGISVLLALRPSFRDMKFLSVTILVLAAVAWLLDYLGIGFTRRTEGAERASYWTELTLKNTGLLIAFALLLLVVSSLTIGVVRFVEWWREESRRDKARRQAEAAERRARGE